MGVEEVGENGVEGQLSGADKGVSGDREVEETVGVHEVVSGDKEAETDVYGGDLKDRCCHRQCRGGRGDGVNDDEGEEERSARRLDDGGHP